MTRSTFALPVMPVDPTGGDARAELSGEALGAVDAEAVLADLAAVFLSRRSSPQGALSSVAEAPRGEPAAGGSVDARYRALVEQMPAVVFMADLDEGIGEAYVSPQIESALGFSQQEWLEFFHRASKGQLEPFVLVEMNWDPITRIVGSLGIFTRSTSTTGRSLSATAPRRSSAATASS